MGAAALNFRVRDGIGCIARAVTTRPGKRRSIGVVRVRRRRTLGRSARSGSDQACRAISTGRLSALPRVHLRPIDVVVFHGPDGETLFRGGLPA